MIKTLHVKFYLFLSLTLIALNGFAQDPNLYQTWYLYSMESEFDTTTVSDFDPPIVPTLIIDASLNFSGQGACDTFNGSFSYSDPEELLIVANSSNTETTCGFYEDEFEIEYFGYLSSGHHMTYIITNDADGYQTLLLHGATFTTLTYRNIALSTPSILKDDFSFSLHPNPTTNKLSIDYDNDTNDLNLTLYSSTGTVIFKNRSFQNDIDVSNLANGLYFMELTSTKGRIVRKFVKQ